MTDSYPESVFPPITRALDARNRAVERAIVSRVHWSVRLVAGPRGLRVAHSESVGLWSDWQWIDWTHRCK